MSDIIIYLLKVSAGLGIIFIPYYFLFRNDPNLVMKRFYLLAGLVAAWVFPLITFRRPDMFVNLTPTVFIDLTETDVQPIHLENSGSLPGITIHWMQILMITYLTGLIFMFLKNLYILIKWNLTWRKTKNDQGVAFTRSDQVFTIFSKIFIPGKLQEKQDLDNVLLHEKAHVQQLHSIDLTLMELTLLLTWFNPFSWLISRMIKENHEHLADRQVLSAGVNPARYRAQLLNHTLGVNVFRLGNQFNHSLTLKRFNMMKKPRKSPLGIIKIALLIPAVLVTLGLTTGMKSQQKPIKGKVVFADTGEPATGASVVIRNGTTGTVVDTEGLFKLNVDGDPEIVFSFVGYSTKFIKASKIGKRPVKLAPQSFYIRLDSVPAPAQKKDATPVFIPIKKDEKEIFWVVEEMPTFNGGDPAVEFRKYIANNLKYPKIAAENGISGRVIVQFTVDKSGHVVDPVVVRGADPALDKEAIRVVMSSTKWTPGKQRGKAVNVLFTFPFNFVLNPKDVDKESKALTAGNVSDQKGDDSFEVNDDISIRVTDDSGKQPVYVLDGKVVEEINNLDPNTIEEITVIKDPNSEIAKKYNAKNGILLITSKDAEYSASQKEKEVAGEVFFIVEDMPMFPGGKAALKSYIYSHLEYPESLKKKGISGEVNVQFLVTTSGKLEEIKIASSTHKEFDKPALEVFKEMPDWNPGTQRGKPVNVQVVVPVSFNAGEE